MEGPGLSRSTRLAVALAWGTVAYSQRQNLLASSFVRNELLPLTIEAEDLAAAYLSYKVVPARLANDARHVAIACVHGIGLVVSWNFQHLVNYQRERAFNPERFRGKFIARLRSRAYSKSLRTDPCRRSLKDLMP